MKNTYKIIFAIIAALVGAGFASGKEIYSFFFIYGMNGIIGIFISSFIISLTIYSVLKLCHVANISNYKDFYIYTLKHLFPKRNIDSIAKISDLIIKIVNYLLLISFYIMISGFSSFLNQEFSINKIIGSLIIIILCYFAFQKNINSLIKLSNYIVPAFIVFLLCISLNNLDFKNNYFNTYSFFKQTGFLAPIIKSILYGSYNCTLLIPVLITIKNYITNSKKICFTSIIIFIIIVLLSLCVFNLLLLGNSRIYSLDMPLIEILKRYNKFIRLLYLFLISSSIYTTAISTGCAFLNGCDLKNYKRNSILICSSAIILSQISFSVFIELLYPILGILGFTEILGIIFGTHLNLYKK